MCGPDPESPCSVLASFYAPLSLLNLVLQGRQKRASNWVCLAGWILSVALLIKLKFNLTGGNLRTSFDARELAILGNCVVPWIGGFWKPITAEPQQTAGPPRHRLRSRPPGEYRDSHRKG